MSFLIRVIFIMLTCLSFAPVYSQDNTDFQTELYVRGRLLTEEGQPATNVTILLEVSDMFTRSVVGADRTQSDIEGFFTFNLDRYSSIEEFGLQFNTISPRYREAMKIEIVKKQEMPFQIELNLVRGSIATGTVSDAEGNPIEGVEISGERLRPVVTNKSGEYEIYGLYASGGTRLSANLDGYSQVVKLVQSMEAGVIENVNFTLYPARTLSGTMRGPDGKPVTDGRIILQLDQRYIENYPDNKGKFEFEGVPLELSTALLYAYSNNYPDIQRSLTSSEIESSEIDVAFAWPIEFTGTVYTPDGKTARGATVLINQQVRTKPEEFPLNLEGSYLATPYETDKAYSVVALPASQQARNTAGELLIAAGGTSETWTGSIEPWPLGYSSTFKITRTGKEIQMIRHDTGSGGYPGEVIYTGKMDPESYIIEGDIQIPDTGAEGTFIARPYLKPIGLVGDWDLRESISAGNFTTAPTAVSVQPLPFPVRHHVDIKMDTPKSITGIVYESEGTPLNIGKVVLVGWMDSRILERESQLQAGGRFKLEGLPKGVLEISVYNVDSQPILDRNILVPSDAQGLEIFVDGINHDETVELPVLE